MNSWSAVQPTFLIAWLELSAVRVGLQIADITSIKGVKYGKGGSGKLHHKVQVDGMLIKKKYNF